MKKQATKRPYPKKLQKNDTLPPPSPFFIHPPTHTPQKQTLRVKQQSSEESLQDYNQLPQYKMQENGKAQKQKD